MPLPVGEFSHRTNRVEVALALCSSAESRSDRDSREKKGCRVSSESSAGAWEWRRVNCRRERSPVEGMMKVPLRSFCAPHEPASVGDETNQKLCRPFEVFLRIPLCMQLTLRFEGLLGGHWPVVGVAAGLDAMRARSFQPSFSQLTAR